MRGYFPDDHYPIDDIETPKEWNVRCVCHPGIHGYGTRGCHKDTRWLDFDWNLVSIPDEGKIACLDRRSYLYRNTLTAIFGSDKFFILCNFLAFRSAQEYLPEGSWEKYNEHEEIYIRALEHGYPALAHLYEFHGLRNNQHELRNWTHPLSQKTFKCLLVGIDRWLSIMLRLPSVEQFLTFNAGIKSNPHIRMSDLPHLEQYRSDDHMRGPLSGPVWNCSLEYLYKLLIGLQALQPLADRCDPRLHTKTLHKRIGNRLNDLTNNLLEGHRLYFSKPSAENPIYSDQLSLVLNNLIHNFATDDTQKDEISVRIGHIRQVIQKWDLSCSTAAAQYETSDDENGEHPELSLSPPLSSPPLSRLRRAWHCMRRKKRIRGKYPDDSPAACEILTPEDWKIECVCDGLGHQYGATNCTINTDWLDFDWTLVTRPVDEKMDWLSRSHTLSWQSLTNIFGSHYCCSLNTLFRSTSNEEYKRSVDRLGWHDNEIDMIKALGNGYPAQAYIYDFYKMRNSRSSTRSWNAPRFQKTFSYVLVGINEWLGKMQTLTPEQLFLTFSTEVKSNPYIRMIDLPHLKPYHWEHEMSSFLSNPVWSCSLEYLYKLSIGLAALRPFAYKSGAHESLKVFFDTSMDRLYSLMKKLDLGYFLYFSRKASNPKKTMTCLPIKRGNTAEEHMLGKKHDKIKITHIKHVININYKLI